jgi:probable biosynthetic protein (TIGR04098 family)
MKAPWHDNRFVVQMPHMAPGERLSEVEFLKILAAYQWSAIAHMLGRKPSEITNDSRERLYGSVIDVEMKLADQHSMEVLGEDAEIRIRNRVVSYAKKFVEGLFVIDDNDIPDEALETLKTREDLRSLPVSWACMTNAFIAPTGGNTRLKVYKPAGIDERDVEELTTPPQGVRLQSHVQGGGAIEPLDELPPGIELEPTRPAPIRYQIVHESDLNGAGLVYFARYESMMNYGERILLGQQLEVPISNELISCLSTEHRKAYFFANASPGEEVDVRVAAELLPPSYFEAPPASRPHRTPMKFRFRLDLYRCSDNVLMATSVVRKALNVPGPAKAVLKECERLLKRWS